MQTSCQKTKGSRQKRFQRDQKANLVKTGTAFLQDTLEIPANQLRLLLTQSQLPLMLMEAIIQANIVILIQWRLQFHFNSLPKALFTSKVGFTKEIRQMDSKNSTKKDHSIRGPAVLLAQWIPTSTVSLKESGQWGILIPNMALEVTLKFQFFSSLFLIKTTQLLSTNRFRITTVRDAATASMDPKFYAKDCLQKRTMPPKKSQWF